MNNKELSLLSLFSGFLKFENYLNIQDARTKAGASHEPARTRYMLHVGAGERK